MIAIKKQEEVVTDQYELFAEEEATTTDGETVTIKKSIGTFSLGDLNNQKLNIQRDYDIRIKDIQDKIDAINSIN